MTVNRLFFDLCRAGGGASFSLFGLCRGKREAQAYGVYVQRLVVGYVSDSDNPTFWSAFRISAAFSLGGFVNLAFLGGLLTSAGLFLGGIDKYTNYIVAAVLFIFGLHLGPCSFAYSAPGI